MIYRTVWEAVGALQSGEATSVSLTEAVLTKIHTSPYGAYLTVCDDAAMEMAAAADKARRDHPDMVHPLCGIPFSLKDNFMTAGIRTTCASRLLADFVPPYDATVYAKLRECGAVLVGKTDMDEFAMGSAGLYSALGKCVNPLDVTRSAGGSSTGAAASVAANEAYFALGSDTGGSARQPSAFCGLVAMKPTYGSVSRYGLAAFASSMDTVCPITHTTADNRLVFGAICGRDPFDMTSHDLPMPETGEEISSLAGVRVGVLAGYAELCDETVRRCTNRMTELLADAGAVLTDVTLPPPEIAVDVYLTTAAAEASSNLARYDGIRYGAPADGDSFAEMVTNARTTGLGAEVKRRILAGKFALSSVYNGDYYRRVSGVRAEIARQMETILASVDVILLPTAATVAFPTDSPAVNPDFLYGSDAFTVYANLAGLPAVQIPSGGDGRLPCGVTFMGRRYAERFLYDIAALVEKLVEPYRKTEWRCADDGK